MIEILREEDVERLYEAVLRVLENVGMMYQNDKILTALEKAGARVDRAQERAWLPRKMVEELVDEIRRETSSTPEPKRSFSAPGKRAIGIQVAQFYHDHLTNEQRAGNRDDFIKMIKFGEAYDPDIPVGHCLMLREVHPKVEALEALSILLEYTSRPSNVYPHYAEEFEYLAEIGEIYAGDSKRFLTGGIFVTSPLRICKRAADFMVKRLGLGLPCGTGTMPVGGASTPVTVAGTIVVDAAEIIGAWVAVRALKPDAPLTAGVGAGAIDMRTGGVSFCSPDAMLYNFGVIEFFRKLCGKRVNLAGGPDYCDTKVPGVKAAIEKALKAMTIAAFLGYHPGVGSGMVDAGKTLSAVQVLLDNEYNEMVRFLAHPIEINDETIGIEEIENIGLGVDRSYIDADHTLKFFRSSLWFTELLDRTPFEGLQREIEKEEEVVKRAAAKAEEIIAGYKKPEVDPDMLNRVRAVVERAKKNLTA